MFHIFFFCVNAHLHCIRSAFCVLSELTTHNNIGGVHGGSHKFHCIKNIMYFKPYHTDVTKIETDKFVTAFRIKALHISLIPTYCLILFDHIISNDCVDFLNIFPSGVPE